jgi:actin-related protein 9
MPPFKDDHILLLAPGSQTTLAQLGLPESYTPAKFRFPSRMFLAPDGKTYEPHKIRSRKKELIVNGVTNGVDIVMAGTTDPNLEGSDGEELIEDPDDDEGAIYPIKGL